MLTRVASSHIRVGTFQYFAARGDTEPSAAGRLCDRPPLPRGAGAEQPYRALLEAVIARQAALVARWLQVGFIHGVMNTDNISISGETIDYGPCAFMDAYDPATVFSSIDQTAATPTATSRGSRTGTWRGSRNACCRCLPRTRTRRSSEAQAVDRRIRRRFRDGLSGRLAPQDSACSRARDGDQALVQDLLDAMAENQADFTLTFRRLERGRADAETIKGAAIIRRPRGL